MDRKRNRWEIRRYDACLVQVIKTGLQPQVDSKEIDTRQKEEHDKMMALDSHFQRIAVILPTLKSDSPKLQKIEAFCKEVLSKWDQLKRDDQTGDIQSPTFSDPNPAKVNWMKQNQPLPEEPRSMAGQAAF